MKRLLALLLLPITAFGAANDIRIQQKNPTDTAFVDRIFAPASGGAFTDVAGFRTAIGAGTGSGTVTSASVVTANGVSATVATATTTPAFTFTLGAITPSSVSTGALTSSALTSGRVPFATTAGLLTDDADLTFTTDTLTFTKGLTTQLTDSGLTSGRVTFASTGGLLADASTLTFSSGTLTVGTGIATGTGTFSSLTSGRVPFASTAGLLADSASLTYNSGTGTLTATTFSGAFSGTATNATNISITDDTTTNATMYPLWVTANTGNLPAKVTSTKLSFNPSTGTLAATNHAGTFAGNTLTTGSSTYTGTAGQTYTFPTTSATIARTDAGNTFTGNQVITSTSTLKFGVTAAATIGVVTDATTSNLAITPPATGAVLMPQRGIILGDGTNGARITATGSSPSELLQLTAGTTSGYINILTPGATYSGQGNTVLVVKNSAANSDTSIQVDAAAGRQTTIALMNGGNVKWSYFNDATGAFSVADSFTIYDVARSAPALTLKPNGIAILASPLKTGGFARITGDVTNATATMSNLTNLSVTVAASEHYVGTIQVFANDSTGADGLAFDLGGGSCTFTDLEFGFAAQPTGSTLGTVTSTTSTTAITLTVVSTSDAVYTISFGFTVNAGGTFIPRFSQVAHTTGTATARKNSSMTLVASTN